MIHTSLLVRDNIQANLVTVAKATAEEMTVSKLNDPNSILISISIITVFRKRDMKDNGHQYVDRPDV